jgi:aspartyl-tRNA synthetase
MLRTHYSSEITEKLDGKKVVVAGWVRTVRDIGKTKFLILADSYGEIQVTVKKGEVSDKILEKLKSLSREDVVSVSGLVKSNKAAPGSREIIPGDINILAKSDVPLPLETDPRIKSNLDTRLDYRFLDMRKPDVRAVFRIKDVIQRSFVKYLEEQGFVLMNTPVIVAAATEGGTNLFPISYFEKEAFLGQSPQLYKQMLMASGFDKVAIVAPVFRAEDHDTTRHLNETIQMDIEAGFVENEQDVLKYMQGVVHFIYSEVKKHCENELAVLNRDLKMPKLPIKQLTYDEALKLVQKEGIKMEWGDDFTPEAERILSKHFNPVITTKWPTKLRAFYSMPEPGNEKICRAYDMVIDGLEVCSGAQRVHNYKQLVQIMKKRGMNPGNFEFYLNAFRYGMPPHAGWSFGLDRLTLVITGKSNIRECVLFPRDRTRLTP